jgi:uncharacterized protein (DUF1330 family)
MKAYVIAIVDITDREGYMRDFMPRSVKAIEAGGGKFLVRGGKTGGDSAPTGRVVVTEYESFEKAEAFGASPEWQELLKMAEKYATIKSYVVEGAT